MLQHITKLWSLQLLVIAVQRGGGIGKSWVGINSGPGDQGPGDLGTHKDPTIFGTSQCLYLC